MNLTNLFPTDEDAIYFVKYCLAVDELLLKNPKRATLYWLVLTIFAHNRNVCAYFWGKSFQKAGTGIDLDRIQAASQILAEQIQITGSLIPEAQRYILFLKYFAEWWQEDNPPSSSVSTVEAVQQFLDQIHD